MSTAKNDEKPAVYFHKDAGRKPTRRWPSGHIRYRGKVTWPNKKRQDVAVPEKYCYSEDRASEWVRSKQEQIDAGGAVALAATAPKVDGETWNEWHARYLDVQSMRASANSRARCAAPPGSGSARESAPRRSSPSRVSRSLLFAMR